MGFQIRNTVEKLNKRPGNQFEKFIIKTTFEDCNFIKIKKSYEFKLDQKHDHIRETISATVLDAGEAVE
jgi:predicted nucleotidyltransferase